MQPRLIIIGGLPGAGKTTLSNALSMEMKIPVFSKDELEATIVRKNRVSPTELDGIGYALLETLTSKQIELGNSVIVDFIASKDRVDQYWKALKKLRYKLIECICSNEVIHKQRIESRERKIPGWYELSWVDVDKIRKNYKPLSEERLILDSIDDINKNVQKARRYVQQ